MEEWEIIVERYEDGERKNFQNSCECAHRVLKDDLAPSEIVWFLDTLLLEPINLLTTIASKSKEPVWLDTIGKSFKLLSSIVEKFPEECSEHFENIVRLCEISFEKRPRAFALQCLNSLVPYYEGATQNYVKHLFSLMNEKTCKAALAELIGTICSHYPDVVKAKVTEIWRVYLSLLDSKHSDTVVSSLLLGASGVLQSFGNDLDTKDFPVFYQHLVESSNISKCKKVYLTILSKHADLFRELLANDTNTRMSLWYNYPASDPDGVNRKAILSVYNAIKQVFTENRSRFNALIRTETFQFKQSYNSELKYTALRVLEVVCERARVPCDMHAIYALRHNRLTFEYCEMILWCLEFDLNNDIKLFKSVLVFYEHIPTKYKKELTVNSLLKASPSVRKMAVIFLINETCQCYKDNGNIDKYLPLWKSLFDTEMKKKSSIFLDFMEYLYQSLLQFKENENLEELPEKLSYLIIVSSHIIPLGGDVVGEGVSDVSRGVLQLLRVVEGAGGAGLKAARMLLRYGAIDVYADMVKDITLDDCSDDEFLYESCLALVLTATRVTDVGRVLKSLQIILSRSDEAPILCRCVNTLYNLLSTRKEDLNEVILNKIMERLEKLNQYKYKGKDGRHLKRELFMLLGKYGRNTYENKDSIETVHLEKYLNFTVPVTNEGIFIKLNLQQIHSLALKYEDTKMLQVLLDLLEANLLERIPNENARRVLCHSACTLLRARPQLRTRILHVCGDVALPILIQFMNTESGEIRSSASTALRQIAQYEKLADSVFDDSTIALSKPAFLDISEMLVDVMKDDNALAQKYLPQIILKITKTHSKQANVIFKIATDLFIDRIELFRNETIEFEILNAILLKQNGRHINKMADVLIIKDKMKLTLDFLKLINGAENDLSKVIENILMIQKQDGDTSNIFLIFSIVKDFFDINEKLCHEIVEEICDKIFFVEEELDLLYLEGILNFCTQFADVLVKSHLEATIKLISNNILKLKPEEIIQQSKNLKKCLKKYEKLLNSFPEDFIINFELWCKKNNIQKIGINLKNDILDDDDKNMAKSLRILINVFNKNIKNELKQEIKNWLPFITENYKNGIKKLHIPYYTDLLHIIFMFLSTHEIENVVMMDGFCEEFISVVFDNLVKEPYDLMKKLLHQKDLMKVLVRYSKMNSFDVLDLVDKLWPDIELLFTFEQKYSLLLEVSYLPNKLQPDSNPMRWLTKTITSNTKYEIKAKLIGLLPPEEPFKSTWSWYAGLLPARLSEAQGENGLLLGALLEALVGADCSLLKTISQLIAGATSPGWWDDAIDAYIVSLSKTNDIKIYHTLYSCCWEGLSLAVCVRLMVPLLRNSSASICEEFFSIKLKDLLSKLKKKPSLCNRSFLYQLLVADYIRALILLRVCIEMVPRTHIESPTSLLYSQMSEVGTNLFYLTKTLSMLCVDLVKNRRVSCPDDADDNLKKKCLLFYCENYNSLTSAIWCRQPSDYKFYALVFNKETWCNIVDTEMDYHLPLIESWQKHTMYQFAGVDLEENSGLLSSTLKTRTRTYLRTLSENPDEFDEGLPQEEQEHHQELCVSENVINQHPCAGILTVSLSRATSLPHTAWLTTLVTTLTTNTHVNVKWLLAQVICNCKEDLKEHASVLSPALLAMVVETSDEELNSLHMDVIDIIIYWGNKDELNPDIIRNINKILEKLIKTIIKNRSRKKIVANLLQKMNLILEMFQQLHIEWSCLSDCVNVTTEELANIYIDILKIITKKLYIKELMEELIKKLKAKNIQTIKHKDIALIYARCVKLSTNINNLRVFRDVINEYKNNLKEYIDIILYALRENKEICDVTLFRNIADYLPKMVDRNRSKCLEILSLSINNVSSDEVITLFDSREIKRLVFEGDSGALVLVGRGLLRMGRGLHQCGRGLVLQSVKHCRSNEKKVREAAFGVLKAAVECLFTTPLESNPKRPARFSSPLFLDEELKVGLAALGMELMADEGLRDAVSSCLPTDVVSRFLETFIICVYLPVLHGDKTVRLTALLDIFFKDVRNETFKRNLITEHLVKDSLPTTSKDTNLATYTSIQKEDSAVEETKTVDDVLETLLQFCKTDEAASALTLQLLTSLQSLNSRSFDFPAAITQLLLPMLTHVCDITPFLIQACRLFVDECCTMQGFKPAVENLLKTVKGTEGEILVEILLEDVEIRLSGVDYFILGNATEMYEDSGMTDLSKEFSLEDVVTSFESLSNWEKLTLQQKSKADRLPPLWTSVSEFRRQLDSWHDTSSNTWFIKMLSIYQECEKNYKYQQWYNEVTRWPKRQFTISATIDALELKKMSDVLDDEHIQELDCHIQPQDCLVEWAIRIMTRSACIQKMYEELEMIESYLSPSHALRWCARANEMALPSQVLHCVHLHKEELSNLSWKYQELLARRQLAFKTSDLNVLSEILVTASSYEVNNPLLVDKSPLDDIIGMNHLIVTLRRDLNELSNDQLMNLLNNTRDRIKASESKVVSNKHVLKNMVEIAITHYDENWPISDATEQNRQLIEMTNILDLGLDLNLDLNYRMFVDVLLHRLSCAEQLDGRSTSALLNKMDTFIHILDDFAIEELKRNQSKLSARELVSKLSRDRSTLKQCLQLMADPRHVLRHYVKQLVKALEAEDDVLWNRSFNRMKEKIFENCYSGVHYQVLNKYKSTLYKISGSDFNDKDSIKESLLTILKEITSQSESLKLSQLCPSLTRDEFIRGSEIEDCLSRLLMLPRGVHVHKFEEQVLVFTDSVRRPVVVTARLTDGSYRRLLVKSGEELRVDAAALRVIRTMGIKSQGYQVTPLSDDTGLIEYLEGHERVRKLIANKYNVTGIESLSTVGEKLIKDSREHSISQYNKMCSKIPAYAFRSVMELNSSSYQDFINKKQIYEESLADMTYVTSLLGLKDRHLENILYEVVGAVRAVDWNSVLQHSQREPPPARLTRCLLAPCSKQVLESRLQALTSETRSCHRLLLATLQVSFKWMEDVQDKLQDVYDLMRGAKLPHQVSQRSSGDFALILEDIFKDFKIKELYTVEEQVTNLLRHCTDPQILAITRSAWEPWI